MDLVKFALRTPSFALEAGLKRALFNLRAFLIPAPLITEFVIKVLERALLRRRFFLWVHYMDLHYPFALNMADLLKKPWKRSRYLLSTKDWYRDPSFKKDAMSYYVTALRQVDTGISSLIEFLNEAGALDNTLIIITADHGEEFFEHGTYDHAWAKLYDELIHVPLVIHPPSSLNPPRYRIDELVGLMDVPTTVLMALNISKPRSLMGNALISREASDETIYRPYIISEVGHKEGDPLRTHWQWYRYAVRTTRWKLIYRPYTGEVRLFDLRKDPREVCNVADEQPDIVRGLTELLRRHIKIERISVLKAKIRKLMRRIRSGLK